MDRPPSAVPDLPAMPLVHGVGFRLLAAGSIALIAWLSGCATPQDSGAKKDSEAATPAPPLDPEVAKVASRFICPCGECKDMDLVECTCERPRGAREVKAVIASLLHSGQSVDQAAATVAKEYGHLKSAAPPTDAPAATSLGAQPSH